MASRRPQREIWSGTSGDVSGVFSRREILIGLTRCSNRSEETRIVGPQNVKCTFGDIYSVLFVVRRAPRKVIKVDSEGLERRGQGVDDLDGGADDLGADAVGRDGGDAEMGNLRHCVFQVEETRPVENAVKGRICRVSR